MDPLSSLSVASSAIQIFEFSSKLWKQIRELHQSDTGTTLAQETILADATRLQSLNLGLCKLLKPENLQRSPTETEESVVSLCKECGDAAEQLVAVIQNLRRDECSLPDVQDVPTGDASTLKKRKPTQPLVIRSFKRLVPIEKRLDAVRAAVKGVWMKKDVEKLCERVETLKHSLASTILVNIQHGLVDLNGKMDFITGESIKWAGAKSFDEILLSRDLGTPQIEAKIMGLVGAYPRTKARNISDDTESSLPEALNEGNPKLESWSAKSHQIIQSLIKSLSFSEMHERQDSIRDNFKGTYQWIYQPPRDVDRSWDSFATWLTEGRGIYWITGKAGSGKSTLMRMLHQNKHTIDLVQTWCSDLPLVTASFFFWNSGSRMQMSQDGLLRSVLLQIIKQRFQHDNCETLKEKLIVFAMMQESFQTFHLKDLIQLLRFVIEDAGQSIKFFLLLDGLDEFDGDKSNLVSLIQTLGQYEHVKVCVSSRPWTVFEDGFRQQPSLMLQNLTHHDILIYTQETLKKEPAFRELSFGDPYNASELIQSITRKASGVFLWVVLTVDSLIKGLTDGDRVKDLEVRLEEIPEELEDLFGKMLHGLEGRYFQDAARLFQIHRATRWHGFRGQAGARLPLLVYAFADEHGAELDRTIRWPPRALSAKECFMISISMKRRINSRCNGLLEISDPHVTTGGKWSTMYKQLDSLISRAEAGDVAVLEKLNYYGNYLARTSVQYLHRTVKDYLEAPDIWKRIESNAPTKGLDYWIMALCLGYIMLWRNSVEPQLQLWRESHPSPSGSSKSPSGPSPTASSANVTASVEFLEPTSLVSDCGKVSKHMLENCIEHAAGFLPSDLQAHMRLLDALGAALFQGGPAEVEFNQPRTLRKAIWEHERLGFIFEDFLSLAVHCNLYEYVADKISRLPPELQVATASRLLVVAAVKCGQLLEKPASSHQDIIAELLEGGCVESVCSEHLFARSAVTKHDLNELDQEEPANPSFHMMLVLMSLGADLDIESIGGFSARRIVDLRRWELAKSSNFLEIVRYMDGCSKR